MIRSSLFAVASLLAVASLAGTASADSYVSGPMYNDQEAAGHFDCRFFNNGKTPVTFKSKRVYVSGTTTPALLLFDLCSAPLQPNATCVYGLNTQVTQSYACKAATRETGTDLRGVAARYNSAGVLADSLPITK